MDVVMNVNKTVNAVPKNHVKILDVNQHVLNVEQVQHVVV